MSHEDHSDEPRPRRPRRLTFTVVHDQTDPIENILITTYDDLPITGHRRQDFLRRTLRAGMALHILATNPDQAVLLLQQFNLSGVLPKT